MGQSTITDEYFAASNGCAVLARPRLGLVRLQGSDQIDLLHRLTTNELRRLTPGTGQINIFADAKGRVIDRVFLLKFDDHTLLLTGADNGEKIVSWINEFIFIEDVEVANLSQSHSVVSLFGPKSAGVITAILGDEFNQPTACGFQEVEWRKNKLVIQHTPELSVPGFNLICATEAAQELSKEILSQGAHSLGDEAYNVLRIEAGWPESGREFDEQINPHEAGMHPFINLDKGCYIGQEVIARLDTYDKVKKRLAGLWLNADTLPGSGDKIFFGETEIGTVTSAAHSFRYRQGIALAHVRTKYLKETGNVFIRKENSEIAATITSLPFTSSAQ